MGRPLKIAKATLLSMTSTAAATGLVTVSENLNTLNIIAGMPFTPNVNRGGLVAGTQYYILKVVSANTFTVSATQLSANPTSTPVTLTNSSTATVLTVGYAIDTGFQNPDSATQSGGTSTNPGVSYGAVGGNTGIYGKQVLARVAIGVNGQGTITVADESPNITGVGTDLANTLSDGTVVTTADGVVLGTITDIANANAEFATFAANSAANATDSAFVYATNEAGFIIRQKGKTKYLVQGATTGLIGACYTANVANTALTPNTMNILATYANSSTGYVESLSNYNLEIFGAGEVLQNAQPAIATFNTAYAANTYGGQPYPIVVISNA